LSSAHQKKYSLSGADASMADARKASFASHFCSDHLTHASQSSSEEPVRAHGRVGVLSCSRFLDGFSDREYRKCLKWVIGKKNALGDKPAIRRAGAAAAPLTWTRLPFATQPLLTTADMAVQRDMVCHISSVTTHL
jgi:hypothetical protein